jgi:VWFA-related protein
MRVVGLVGVAAVVIGTGAAVVADGQARSGIRRDVYLTAIDQNGAHVLDLSAADLQVREEGKDREILRLEPARSKLRVALAVEETLTPDIAVRRALAGFIDRVHESGDVALYVIGRRTERRVPYTSDLMALADAINAFPSRAVYDGVLVEALQEIAREQRSLEGRRVLVTLAMELQQLNSVTADGVFEQLRDGGAIFYAATLFGFYGPTGMASSGGRNLALENQTAGLERDRLFSEGTKQSGGLHLSIARTEGLTMALHQVASDLQHQYLLSYVLPDGTRSDGEISVKSRRKGVTVRAASRLRPL